MKIICKKGCSVKSALQIVSEYIEKKGLEYPLISGDLEIEISLKNQKGEEYPGNNQTVYFDEKELELLQRHEKTPDYYNIDALTGLYNRGKFWNAISHPPCSRFFYPRRNRKNCEKKKNARIGSIRTI